MENKKCWKTSHLEAEQANADPSNQQQVLLPPLHYYLQAAVDINAFLYVGFIHSLSFVTTHGIEHSL